jgi:Sir2 family
MFIAKAVFDGHATGLLDLARPNLARSSAATENDDVSRQPVQATCGRPRSGRFPTFTVPACRYCDVVLKPDVVFFGEKVRHKLCRCSCWISAASRRLPIVGYSFMGKGRSCSGPGRLPGSNRQASVNQSRLGHDSARPVGRTFR